MTDDRMGGLALIAGTVGTIVTMALHPTGRELLLSGDQFARMALLTAGVHSLAIVCIPVSFLGALALSRRLAAPDRVAVAALVTYGVALVAVMSAAVVSGFAGPDVARQMAGAAPDDEVWRALFRYTNILNQAFARVFVVASSTAIVLWSAAIVRTRLLGAGVGMYGLLIGPLVIVAVGSGHVKLDVHGFGAVVLIQAVWFVIVGTLLCRQPLRGQQPAAA